MTTMRFMLFTILVGSFHSARPADTNPATTFTANASFFKETNTPVIHYYDLLGIAQFSKTLRLNETASIFINNPTLVQCINVNYIVYPGDHIQISIDQNADLVFVAAGNPARTRELYFQNMFRKLDQKIAPKFPEIILHCPLDTVLLIEQKIKAATPVYLSKSRALFDSLSTAYAISEPFKQLADFIRQLHSYATLNWAYHVYRDTLKANNLYVEKQLEALPVINQITKKEFIYLGDSYTIESLFENISGKKIRSVKTEVDLIATMDAINQNLKNLSRDFLLTKLVYTVINKQIAIADSTLDRYYRACKDEAYKSIVQKLYANKKNNAAESVNKTDNRIIALSDLKVYTLEEAIARQKGKLVLIDLWASWCVPCLKEMPYSEQLKKQFAGKKISFLYLSMDRDITQWQHKSEDIRLKKNSSFVFENHVQQSFLKRYNVSTIPRYMLIDQNGKMINADVPRPSDPKLKKLIAMRLKTF
jgi:thiol-disulfide isomerase/thioredoxin